MKCTMKRTVSWYIFGYMSRLRTQQGFLAAHPPPQHQIVIFVIVDHLPAARFPGSGETGGIKGSSGTKIVQIRPIFCVTPPVCGTSAFGHKHFWSGHGISHETPPDVRCPLSDSAGKVPGWSDPAISPHETHGADEQLRRCPDRRRNRRCGAVHRR